MNPRVLCCLVLPFVFVLLAFTGTSSPALAETDAAKATPTKGQSAMSVPFTMRDDLGRSVAFTKPVMRIASLAPSFTEALFAVGCGQKIVLRDRWGTTPQEAEAIPATDAVQLSPEHIAGYRPDVVILHLPDDRHVRPFQALGIPLLVYNPQRYNDAAKNVEDLGRLCGQPAKGKELAFAMRNLRSEVEKKAASLPKTRVYIELDYSDPLRPYTAGKGSFIDELIGLAGGENIAGNMNQAWVPISAEAVIRADPAVLILLNQTNTTQDWASEFAAKRPAWKTMSVVKTGRIITDLDSNLIARPGPRLGQGLQKLFEILHPSEVRR